MSGGPSLFGSTPQPSTTTTPERTSLFGPAPKPSPITTPGRTSLFGPAPQPSSTTASAGTSTFGAVPLRFGSAPKSSPTSSPPPISCPNIPAEPATKVFDEDGDLLLKVGTKTCVSASFGILAPTSHSHFPTNTFRVCSRTMARASLVWKKLLFGGFAESKPKEGDWIVALPDDSAQAMSTLLGIVHAKFDAVPRASDKISLEELYQLTILTDKYDLTHVLKPWACNWLRCVWSPKCIFPYSNMQQLWITWSLGDLDRFPSAANLLALNMSSERILKTNIAPPGVSETILRMHQGALTQLLKPFHGLLLDLSETQYAPKLFNRDDTALCYAKDTEVNKERCNLLMLGYFTRALRTAGIIPQRKPQGLFTESTTGTVSEVATKLLDIIKKRPALTPSHTNCCPVQNAVGNITSITESLRFTPSEAQIKLLREQALKSGLS